MNIIKITGNTKISSIKEKFNKVFPFLKIEFFSKKHNAYQGTPRSFLVDESMNLNQAFGLQKKGAVLLHENMSVNELEQAFQKTFNIAVQVFRKSGRSWIETSLTDNWSLKHQNEEGKELSSLTNRES
jgi:hypothetical protein